MKIKLGDWVRYNSTGNIEKVTEIDGDRKYINRVDVKDCNKLPIKFKPFEICHGIRRVKDFIVELRIISKGKEDIVFNAVKTNTDDVCTDVYVSKGKAFYPCPIDCFTIEEARDWLELQYATILAKTKNII